MIVFLYMKPIFFYDGECPFCVRCANAWESKTGERVEYRTLQSAGRSLDSVVFVVDEHEYRAARAVVELFALMPRGRWLRFVYMYVPFGSRFMEWFYHQISLCRECGEKFGWMLGLKKENPPQ